MRLTLPPLVCDHCGSEDVLVHIETVKPHGKRIVYTCGKCNTHWITT